MLCPVGRSLLVLSVYTPVVTIVGPPWHFPALPSPDTSPLASPQPLPVTSLRSEPLLLKNMASHRTLPLTPPPSI